MFLPLHLLNTLPAPPMFLQAGGYVKESVVHNLISLVSNAEELQPYAVRRLHSALVDALAGPGAGEPSLLYAAAWCIGEYGEMLPTGEGIGVGVLRGDASSVCRHKCVRVCDARARSVVLASIWGGEQGHWQSLVLASHHCCTPLLGALETMVRCCQQEQRLLLGEGVQGRRWRCWWWWLGFVICSVLT